MGGINPLLDRQYQYDGANNITAIANSVDVSKSQEFAYDPLDRLVNAEGIYGLIDYTYDPVGNRLFQRIQSSGDDVEESYTYANNSNQLLYVDKSTNGIPSQSREFTYDAAGNRISGHGENGDDHSYEYNAANRLASVAVNEDESTSYVYNPLGQRIQKLKADGTEERYHYNEAGQLLSVTDGNGDTLREYIYRDAQQVALITRAPGDASGEPNPPSEPSPILVLDESTVSFQGNHTIDNLHTGWTGSGFIDYVGEGSADWSVNIPSAGTYTVRVRYAFVSTSSRPLKIFVNGVPGLTINFPATGNNNQWEIATETVVLPAGNITFGLATTGKSGANIDSVELQKTEPLNFILLDEVTATFQGGHQITTNMSSYNGSGFVDVIGEGQVDWPLTVDVDTDFNMDIRYSLLGPSRPMQILLNGIEIGYAGFQPTGSFSTWSLFNIDVAIPAGNHTLSLKTLGSSGPNIDQIRLLAASSGDTPVDPAPPGELTLYYIHNDHLGTPQVVTNAQQQVVWMADYLPFGQVMPNLNNEVELYSRFPGQYMDEETGNYYNYFRDYDPSIGRYIQSDPIGLKGGINTYGYALLNPLKWSDFVGLEVTTVCRKVNDWRTNLVGGMKHCAVFVWHLDENNCKVIDRQFSLAANRTPFPQGTNTFTYNADTDAFNNPGGNNEHHAISIPQNWTQEQFDQSVINSGDFYATSEDYSAFWGPNSNTAANNIINNAGGVAPEVEGAWRQNYDCGCENNSWGGP